MSKLINVNCLHFIGCQNYTNVLIHRVLYQIQVTALLPFFLSILHLLLQVSKIMLRSTVKLLLAKVMSIIFGPLKTLPRSSKSCDCVTFRVLKYLLSTFLLYTPHCPMILSKQKCCLWSTGVSTESQKRTSVLQIMRIHIIHITTVSKLKWKCTDCLEKCTDSLGDSWWQQGELLSISYYYLCTSLKAGFFSNKKYDSYTLNKSSK